jgi:hypothetical protein
MNPCYYEFVLGSIVARNAKPLIIQYIRTTANILFCKNHGSHPGKLSVVSQRSSAMEFNSLLLTARENTSGEMCPL